MSSKRYYSKVAGSRFCFSDGQDVIFAFGFTDINEKSAPGKFQGTTQEDPNNGRLRYQVYQEELDAILGRNPLIFVQDKLPEKVPEVQQNALSEADLRAKDTALARAVGNNLVAQQEIGVSGGDGQPTDPNASTADIALRNAFANEGARVLPANAGNANGRVAQIRAEMEAKRISESAAPSISGS